MQVGRQTKTTRQSDGRDSGERLKEKFKRNSKHEGLSKRIEVASENFSLSHRRRFVSIPPCCLAGEYTRVSPGLEDA